tara:strand:+ start:503 stop:1150 length:648 start_codon:yes stop_codon:yes gene_type:complete
MKKFLASIFAAAAIATPVSAEDKVKSWRSFDSVGCMMLRECTEGVRRVNRWEDLGPEYEIAAAELDKIIQAMDKVGAAVYIANEKYFALRMRGVYDVRGNNMFLNEFYIDQPTKIIQVIRHEGWHAAQDCMAGTLNNTFTALIHPEEAVPDWIRRGAERTYPTNVLPFEAEAMWAMYVENKTVEALKVCGSSKKMWEHYTPTPLTGEWLKKKGFM